MNKEDLAPEILDLGNHNEMEKYQNKDLMQNLQNHLKYLEDKHNMRERKAILTAGISGLTGILSIPVSGFAHLNPAPNEIFTSTNLMPITVLGVTAAIIAGTIAYNQHEKAEKYKYFRKLAEAGLDDCEKLEQTKEILRKNLSIISEIQQTLAPGDSEQSEAGKIHPCNAVRILDESQDELESCL